MCGLDLEVRLSHALTSYQDPMHVWKGNIPIEQSKSDAFSKKPLKAKHIKVKARIGIIDTEIECQVRDAKQRKRVNIEWKEETQEKFEKIYITWMISYNTYSSNLPLQWICLYL